MINTDIGTIQTSGTLSGEVDRSFNQNYGVWRHQGKVRLRKPELKLKGSMTIDGIFEREKSESVIRPITLRNEGQTTLRIRADVLSFIRETLYPITLINHKELTLTGQDLTGQDQMVFAAIHNHANADFILEGDWGIQTVSRGIEVAPLSQMSKEGRKDNGAFVNDGNLWCSGDLDFSMKALGKAHIGGSITYSRHLRSLGDLSQIQAAKHVKAWLGRRVQLTHDLDLSAIKFLELFSDFPMTIAAKLTTHALRLQARAQIQIGRNLQQFGEIQTIHGNLLIKAPTIMARYARFYAKRWLHLQGDITLGGYVVKTSGAAQVGSWKESIIDEFFAKVWNPHYRVLNGTVAYGETLWFEGQLDLSCCLLFSDLETRLRSQDSLNLVSVDFLGNGNLLIKAPRAGFDVDEADKLAHPRRKPVRELNLIYETSPDTYVLSYPSNIVHGGDVQITVPDGIRFVGTNLSAQSLVLNGKRHSAQSARGVADFIPIHQRIAAWEGGQPVVVNHAGASYLERIWQGQSNKPVKEIIAPILTLGKRAAFDLEKVQGILGLDVQKIAITANAFRLSNPGYRKPSHVLGSQLVNLETLPFARNLDKLQNTLGHRLPGKILRVGEIPLVFPSTKGEFDQLWQQGWSPSLKSRFQVPMDGILLSALAQYAGRVHHQGLSGRALIKKVVADSKALAKVQPIMGQHELSAFQRLLLIHLLRYNQQTKTYDQPTLHALIPESAQNPRHQPGVLSFAKGRITATGNLDLANYELNVGKNLVLKGKNVKMESTAQTITTGRTTTMVAPAPMTMNIAPGSKVTVKAAETSELKATQIKMGKGSTVNHTAGQSIKLTALSMTDSSKRKGKNKSRSMRTDHHLGTVIEGVERYIETAPRHDHQGSILNNETNHLKGNTLHAETVLDYQQETMKKTKRSRIRKKSKTTTEQVLIGAGQPSYIGKTILDLNLVHGQGAYFSGTLLDRTQALILRPAIAERIYQLRKNSRWLGVSKGLKAEQGKEEVISSEIHGRLLSKCREDKDAENILHLTSTILDLHASRIEKKFIEAQYIPHEWHQAKQTGNFKEVALTVSLIASVASMAWGGALFASLQNALLEAMATAAFSSVCAQTASSMVIHQGKMHHVAEDLLKSDALKKVAVVTITAGATKGILNSVNLPPMPDLAKRFCEEMIKSAVKLHVEYAIHGGSYCKLLEKNALDAVITATHGLLCHTAGDWYGQGQIDFLTHKLAHGAIGALTSKMQHENWAAGAIGAMAAETVAEVIMMPQQEHLQAQSEEIARQLESGTISTEEAEIRSNALVRDLSSLKSSCMDIGKYAAIAAATIARQNPATALRTATTALEENFAAHLAKLLPNLAAKLMKRLKGAKEAEKIPPGKIPGEVPGRVQSRINIRKGDGTSKSPGLENAWRKHGEGMKDNKSQFTISKEEVKAILQDKRTINSPVGIIPGSGNFVREVDTMKIIGNLPSKKGLIHGPKPTSKITIITDSKGNLVNAYPGPFKY